MVKPPALSHELGWLSPGPMWGAFGDLSEADRRQRFARPAILRFASDAFMEELIGTLALQPEKMAEWHARWETWEQPMPAPSAAKRVPRNEPLSRRAVQLIRGPALLGRGPRAGDLAVSPAPDPDLDPARPLKLYQPVQNRFYLVSASLVCQRPGLPDRHVNPGRQDQVGFVLRRRVAPDTGAGTDRLTWDEYGFVHTAHGARWRKLPAGAGAAALLPGEERLPMFSLGYSDSGNHPRRLFAGLIPVGRREAYVGAAFGGEPAAGATEATAGAEEAADAGPDTRALLFALQVTGPWRELVASMQIQRGKFHRWEDLSNSKSNESFIFETKSARERAQTASWYVMLDFVRFLQAHIEPVWEVLAGRRARSQIETPEQEALLAYLEQIRLTSDASYATGLLASAGAAWGGHVLGDLKAALAAIAANAALQEALEESESAFKYGSPAGWPSFLFPLADPDVTYGPCPLVASGTNLHGGTADMTNAGFDNILATVEGVFDELDARVRAALPQREGSVQPDINIATELPRADADAWFTIRCVYECPNCGPLRPPLLSAPTEPFQMASFFDPEAPARQVRIPMPVNISPAGLRRYNKSATLVVSDMLCGQLKRIRKLTLGDLVLSVLPWPFHKDLPEPGPAGSCADSAGAFGMLCSLSIPIVTLCALILLLIIVALFDLFFRWIPLLFLCFPIPGFKAKK